MPTVSPVKITATTLLADQKVVEGNAAMATYSLSAALGADTVVNASVVGNGADAGADYGALFYRTGSAAYSDLGWIAVTGNQVNLTVGLTNFQMKVDVKTDGITEYGESVSFVIEQLASSTALVNSWYVSSVIQLLDTAPAPPAPAPPPPPAPAPPPSTNKLNDFVVLQSASAAIVGSDKGDDTYLISGSMISAGQTFTISDTIGKNSIQLANGLLIVASQVTSNALQLTLGNGGTVTVLSADLFTYDVGANTTAGIDYVDVDYLSFVKNTLGVAVPTTGVITGVVNGGVKVIGTDPAKSVIPVSSKLDDFVVLQYASPATVGADIGNDTYLISGSMVSAGQIVTISDTIGNNSIQLASGLSIASSQVFSGALKLTLTNGGQVTVLDADKFTYDVGGNNSAGIDNLDVSYAIFVKDTLGVTMPAAVGTSVNGGAQVIGATPATVLVAGSSVPVTATSGADVFSFVPSSATTLSVNTQIVVDQFNTAQDKFQFDLITALSGKTLADLNGVEGISVQVNPFTNSTLINFGPGMNGNPVTLTLAGVINPALVVVDVI